MIGIARELPEPTPTFMDPPHEIRTPPPRFRGDPGEVSRFERLTASGIARAFGPTQAIRSAAIELRSGEVLALMGENGSGKSTLVKILAGVQQPDAGAIEIDGEPVRFRSPRAAISAGIVAVFQEILVAGSRSVVDNVWLGVDGLFRTRVAAKERYRRAGDILGALLERTIDLDQPVELLSISDRQACCVARALVREPRMLLLDEASSALDVATRERLFAIVRQLARSGTGVIFISHRMDEVEEVADRIVVMRAGETVGGARRGEASRRHLLRLMAGAERVTEEVAPEVAARPQGGALLEVRGVSLRPGGRPIDLTLRSGELLGLAGLEGHGQDRFLQVLRGAGGAELVVHGRGRTFTVRTPHEAAAAGVAYVPRDRSVDGIFEALTVRDNFALPTLPGDTVAGLLRASSSERRFETYVERLGIRLHSSLDRITTLSGGSQQKVVMARWLAASPRVLLLNDPTRGVDHGTKQDIYRLLADLTAAGVGVVMLSTEVDELVRLMDRVLVFREQELFTEVRRRALTSARLVAAFFGLPPTPPQEIRTPGHPRRSQEGGAPRFPGDPGTGPGGPPPPPGGREARV